MADVIEYLEDTTTFCNGCRKQITMKNLLVKDTKPYKRLTFTECDGCGIKETIEEDFEVLDYAVKITCDFSKEEDISSNIRKMAFINHHAEVALFQGTEQILAFNAMQSNVDCIDGILVRAEDIITSNSEITPGLKEIIEKIEECRKHGFKMIITDKTGYSRVCPTEGIEYTEIQDTPLEKLCTETIIHEKIPVKIDD
ncbi:hypothetical protein GINT2_002354 [Glugoides intestinalis]